MSKILRRLPESQRANIRVYKDDPAMVDQIFDAIGLGHMNRHQQYSYMASYLARSKKVRLPKEVA